MDRATAVGLMSKTNQKVTTTVTDSIKTFLVNVKQVVRAGTAKEHDARAVLLDNGHGQNISVQSFVDHDKMLVMVSGKYQDTTYNEVDVDELAKQLAACLDHHAWLIKSYFLE